MDVDKLEDQWGYCHKDKIIQKSKRLQVDVFFVGTTTVRANMAAPALLVDDQVRNKTFMKQLQQQKQILPKALRGVVNVPSFADAISGAVRHFQARSAPGENDMHPATEEEASSCDGEGGESEVKEPSELQQKKEPEYKQETAEGVAGFCARNMLGKQKEF